MRRILALAAPLVAAVLAGCQTVEDAAAPIIYIPPLQPAVYSNVTPMPGVTYVALDEDTTVFIEELMKYVLKQPETARFDRPLTAAQEGDVLQICGTLSAVGDGNARYALVPFALTLLLDAIAANDLDNAAVVYGVGDAVLIPDIGVATRDDAEIRAMCRDYLGITLQAPAGARTAASAPPLPALAPRLRP